MAPDELRGLAETLRRIVPNEDCGHYYDDVSALDRTVVYLLACADPKPVAWQYRWKGSRELHYTLSDPAERDTQEIIDVQPLYSAPASPQAEPKREPLAYEQLVSACYTYRHDFGLLDPDEQELVIEEAGRWAKAFGIEGSDAE